MIIYLLLVCVIGTALATESPNATTLQSLHGNEANISPRAHPDAFLPVDALIKKYGYPVESHSVQTSDGYILTMNRIPKKTSGYPVFLMHGLLASAADWIVSGPQKALGYILSDAGYDVWLGNARGNVYSKKHTNLSPKKHKFWDFSWHEIGYYDLPAMIDYVLNYTNHQRLHYIGHSQGTTTFFVMTSMRPEYNSKIKSMNALSPVVYSGHMKSPVIRLFAPIATKFHKIFKIIGYSEFLPDKRIRKKLGQIICKDTSWTAEMCQNIAFLIFGYNPKQINSTLLSVYLGHTPAGSSSKQIVHYAQLKQSGMFAQFDYNKIHNLIHYRQNTPPSYPLRKVTSRVALHYSDNDWLSATVDVKRLYREIRNPIGMFKVADPDFAHNDYVWGIEANKLVYDKVIKIIKENEK